MKLTQEQINYLFSFCTEQGIIHYDVQIEMVDHLTEWIENNWEKQPDASFTNLIEEAKEVFPAKELKEIVKQKEKFLKKELVKHYKNEFISFFTLPKITLSILIIALYFFIPWNSKRDTFQLINIPIQLVNLYTLIYYRHHGKNIVLKNKDEKIHPLLMYEKLEWLLRGYILIGIAFFIFLILSFFPAFNFQNKTTFLCLKTVMPLTIIALLSFIHVQVKINKKIRELYPTAFANS